MKISKEKIIYHMPLIIGYIFIIGVVPFYNYAHNLVTSCHYSIYYQPFLGRYPKMETIIYFLFGIDFSVLLLLLGGIKREIKKNNKIAILYAIPIALTILPLICFVTIFIYESIEMAILLNSIWLAIKSK